MDTPKDPGDVTAARENRLRLTTAVLGVVSAILAIVGTVLGLTAKQATSKADDSQQQVQSLQNANAVLATQSVQAQQTIASLRAQISASPAAEPSDPDPSAGDTAAATKTRLSLDDLCRLPGAQSYICGVDDGTIEVGDQVFPYVAQGNGNADNEPPSWHPLLSLSQPSNCGSLTVRFASDQGGTATIRLTQVGAAAQEGHAGSNRIGTFTAKLNGSAFNLTFNTSDGRPIFASGTATCTE